MTVVYKDLKHVWWARGVDLTQEEAEKKIRIALVARGVIPIDASVECESVLLDGEWVYSTVYNYEPKRQPKPRRRRPLFAGDHVICRASTPGVRSVYGNVVEVLRVTRDVYVDRDGEGVADRVRVQGIGQYGFDQWNARSDQLEWTDLPLSEAIQF